MTKEEAIAQLQSRINTIKMTNSQYKINKSYKKEIEALNMSIELWKNQKTGHWKYTTHYARPYRVCPFCGCEREDDHSTGWNYCPNCGKKME